MNNSCVNELTRCISPCVCIHQMELESYTIEVLYGSPVHPVHLKHRLVGQVAGLHYGAGSVDVGQTQNMTDLMDSHLRHNRYNSLI